MGIEAKKDAEQIAAGLELPWYKDWTGKAAKDNVDNVKHVYAEMMGEVEHERLGILPAALDYLPPREPAVTASLPAILRE